MIKSVVTYSENGQTKTQGIQAWDAASVKKAANFWKTMQRRVNGRVIKIISIS